MRASLIDQTCLKHGKLLADQVYRQKWRHKIYVMCKQCNREIASKWYYENQQHSIDRVRNYNRRLREEIILEYGGQCQCCGEKHFEFLTIDHVNGDGASHRKHIFGKNSRHTSSTGFFQWLKKNGFPKEGFRLLCFNCNCARGFHGFCPHNPDDIQDRMRGSKLVTQLRGVAANANG